VLRGSLIAVAPRLFHTCAYSVIEFFELIEVPLPMPLMSSRCPVPAEQQPINEYQDMRESWFYSWGGRALGGYVKPLVVLWITSWIVTGPVAAVSFAPGKHPLPFLLSAGLGALALPVLTLMQLYTGWLHVGRRLQRKAVPYEESGWYDGQIWIKPDDILNRDRLIADYQVEPILRRIQRTLGWIAGLLALGLISWQFV